MTYSPTAKQLALLRFIHGYQEAKGYSPSLVECAVALGNASKSTIHFEINGLVERGHIRRLRNRARAIELIDPPPIPRCPRGEPLYFVPIKQEDHA